MEMKHDAEQRTNYALWGVSLALALVGLGGYVLWLASGVLVKDGNWVGVDFHVYYAAARVVAQGQDIYAAGISPPYVYPPLLAILTLPLAMLPLTVATITWKVLQHICLLAVGGLLVSLLPRGVRPLAAGAMFFSLLPVPVRDEVLLGESNSLVLLLVVGAVWFVVRGVEAEGKEDGRESERQGDTLMAAAGTLLGLAVSIKVLPVLLVVYLWLRGPRRVALIAVLGFVTLQVASLVVAGTSTLRYWTVEFPSLFGQAFPFLDNQSFNAAISRALLPTDPSLPNMQLGDGEVLRAMLTWAANLAAFGALALVLRSVPRPVEAREREEHRVAVLLEVGLVLLTIHLVSGSTWMHHLVDLSVPVCGLLGAWWPGGMRRVGFVSLFGIIGGAAVLLMWRPSDWLALLGGVSGSNALAAFVISNSGLWAVLGVWVATAIGLRRLWGPALYQSSRRAALAAK
jgi:alpha-1,2-mannosyltransferase